MQLVVRILRTLFLAYYWDCQLEKCWLVFMLLENPWQEDNFQFANLPFERERNPFLKGLFLFIRIFANYKIKLKLHIL